MYISSIERLGFFYLLIVNFTFNNIIIACNIDFNTFNEFIVVIILNKQV
ncbi:MAG: hypothetical protein N4P91_01830 [Candidatus Lightella neohaematopini]|nr:hypothetical protein [Candidatus Lightella neohaematopini]